MASNSKIEWTDASWNPIRAKLKAPIERPDPADKSLKILVQPWGYHCEKISPGCAHCYAESMNGRLLPAWGTGLEYTVPNTELVDFYLDEQVLTEPLRWKKPRTIFPCSMTDGFGSWVPDSFLDRMLAVAALTPRHRYLFLTKRADRMREYLSGGERHTPIIDAMNALGIVPERIAAIRWPLPNVMFGCSVENQEYANKRRESMRQLAEAGWSTFASYEPALGPVDWTRWSFLRWAIFGGESGPGARPCDAQWGRNAVRQWRAAGTKAFVKQMGSVPLVAACRQQHFEWGEGKFKWWQDERSGMWRVKLKDKKGADWSEWPDDLRVREFPTGGAA